MHKNITLNEARDKAFLADQAYKNFANGDKVTNPATGSSFEVVEQKNEYTAFEKGFGFSATVFKNTETNEYVIAFRGSNDKRDWLHHNIPMGVANTGEQFSQASAFAKEEIARIQAQNPDAKISLTGTSLGGNLAQYVAYETGHEAVTYNAVGAKYSIRKRGDFDPLKFEENSKNVINIVNKYDVVPELKNHYGRIFALDDGRDSVLDGHDSQVKSLDALFSQIDKKINETLSDHDIETLLGIMNRMDENTFAEHMDKPSYNNDNAILDDPVLRTIMDDVYHTFNYYKNATRDSLINDLKYIGEMLFDKLFGDTLNISLYDPIALDLNNNGKIDTLSLENGVFFDHNGDEIAFKSSWISGGDGILARDINGDKEINSGAELFGNFTKLKNGELAKNGAEALSDLDDNNDGLFDESDKAFDEILVWQDFNSNGKAESNELKSLSEHGIKSINLEFLDDNTALDKDNKQILVGSFSINDSDNALASDIDFSVDTIQRNILDDTDGIIKGTGFVRDFKPNLSKEIGEFYAKYKGLESKAEQISATDELVALWAKTAKQYKELDNPMQKVKINISSVASNTTSSGIDEAIKRAEAGWITLSDRVKISA